MTKEKCRAIYLALTELDTKNKRVFTYKQVDRVAKKYGVKPTALQIIGCFKCERTIKNKQNEHSNSKQK